MHIRRFEQQDFCRVQVIYQQGIATQNATFQQSQKSWQQWQDSMIKETCIVLSANNCESSENSSDVTSPALILGWAGLSATSTREVYAGVAEVSIYVDPAYVGQGIGQQLLQHLVSLSEDLGFWTLQAAIFPENEASLRLHLSKGFKLVGRRTALGKMHGVWRDVLLIERRSTIVGIDKGTLNKA